MSFWDSRRVTVIGGAGMIGSRLAELLVEQGAKVTVIDNFERGKPENLAEIRNSIRIVRMSATNEMGLVHFMKDQEIVFDLAAKVTAIDYNASHNAEMFAKNMMLAIVPLRAAVAAGVDRIHLASTVCVYPHDAPIPTPESAADVANPEPTNAGYGYAKLMGERYAQWLAREHGAEIAITRFANAYDVERDYFDWETSHVIPAFIRKCVEREQIEVWGDGEQRREFLNAKDAAIGAMLICEKYPAADPVNVGAGCNISMNELLTKIQNIMGINKPVFHTFEKPTGHRERMVDNSKLRTITHWTPNISFEDGLKEMIAHYKGVN